MQHIAGIISKSQNGTKWTETAVA